VDKVAVDSDSDEVAINTFVSNAAPRAARQRRRRDKRARIDDDDDDDYIINDLP